MKGLTATLLMALFLITAAGCGSAYKVVTTDQTYTNTERPEYDSESETFTFEDEDGDEVTIKREDLKVFKEMG